MCCLSKNIIKPSFAKHHMVRTHHKPPHDNVLSEGVKQKVTSKGQLLFATTCLSQQGLMAPLFLQQTLTEQWTAFIVFKYAHAPCTKLILATEVPSQARAGFGSLFFQSQVSSHTKHIHWSLKIYVNQSPLQLTYQQIRPWHSWVDTSQVTTASSEFP